MGWTPRPRWERTRRRWYFSAGGKRYTSTTLAGITAKYAAAVGAQPPDERRRPKTVADAIDGWLLGQRTPHREYCLHAFFEFAGTELVGSLDSRLLERYVSSMRKRDLSLQTQRHLLTHAWRVLLWCQTHRWIDKLPVRPKLPKQAWKPRALTSAELADLLAALAEPRRRRVSRVARFMLGTGARPSEARLLKWADVDTAAGTCVLRQSKTGKPRTIYLTPDALAVLSETPRSHAWVFVSREGKPYTRDGLGSCLQRLGLGPYRLRHTFAQHALRQTGDITIVSGLLGHSTLAPTQAYVRVDDQTLRRAAAALSSPLSAPRDANPPASTAPPVPASAPAVRASRKPSPRKRPKGRRRRTA